MERHGFSRRDFVIGSLGAIGGTLAGGTRARAAAAGFRIGACDWTIGKRSDPAALGLAGRLGLDGIQADIGGPKNGMPLLKPEVRQKYLEAAASARVEIASLALGTLNEFPFKSDPRAEGWVEAGVEACRALGVRVVLLAFFGNGDLLNDPRGVEAVVERLKRVAPKAEKAGVLLGFESWLSAEQHLDILRRVGSPALKVYYDVGNSHKQGHDIYGEIRTLGRNLCEFHAKDYDDLYGKGSIDFVKVRRAMDDIGYRGWIHMEGTQMPLGMEESVRYDERYLRTVFPRTLENAGI
jgi:sugar phosphate isomerase/epimerase